MDISKLGQPIRIEVPEMGEVEFLALTMARLGQMEEACERSGSDREVMLDMLTTVWSPSNDPPDVRTLDQTEVDAAAQAWAAHPEALNQEFTDEGEVPARFRDAFRNYQRRFAIKLPNSTVAALEAVARQQEELRRRLEFDPSSAASSALLRHLDSWNGVSDRVMRDVTRSLSRIDALTDLTARAAELQSSLLIGYEERWWTQEQPLAGLRMQEVATAAFRQQEALLSSVSIAFARGPHIDALLDFSGFTHSVERVWTEWNRVPDLVAQLPDSVVRAPVIDLYAHSTSSALVSGGAVTEEPPVAFRRQSERAEAQLSGLLERVRPGLSEPYHGVLATLEARGPDRVRHFAVSARELIGHALRALAPDGEVANWSEDPRHFHDGRPTRKARLEYILRDLASDGFDEFLEIDVSHSVRLLDALNKESHRLETDLTHPQLRLIFRRIECLLLVILDAGE